MDDKPKPQAEKPSADWERIEQDYRAGLMSLREIASPYKITETAIRKRAKRDGWSRDLEAKIQARADELVRKAEVRKTVRNDAAITDRQIIESNAERIAQVRGEHRAIGNRVGTLGLKLLTELELQSANPEDLEKLGELMRDADENGMDKLNDLYRKVISTPSRIDSAKKAAETLKHAIGMEREAYGMDSKAGEGDNTVKGGVSYRANMPARG